MLRIRPRFDALVLPAAASVALAFFRLYSPPAEPVLLCGFRWLTSLPCPFCGMTRALCALARGQLAEAVQLHLLSPAVFALLLAMAATGLARGMGLNRPVLWERPRFWSWTMAVFAAFGLLRIARLTL